jgi:ATP-dependent Clp protease ATP-binding subunit ClpC
MSRATFRVYFVPHASGHLTGILVRPWSRLFDLPAPSGFGVTEEDVYQQLEAQLREREATGTDVAARYLWTTELEVRSLGVDVHPQTTIDKRAVIGKRQVPLRLYYATTEQAKGGHRVMLPRFDWQFVIEDLVVAPEVLRGAITTAMLGEEPKLLYDFRHDGEEYVREWSPDLLLKLDTRVDEPDEAEDFPTLRAVAEEWVSRAARGKLPVIVGMDVVPADQLRVLEREPPRSVLLVGEPGVGKTTWVRRLAKHLAQIGKGKGKTKKKLWATSQARLIAGMIYVGMWQERCLSLIAELAHEGDYLYVDRLTGLLAEQPDGASIAELLQPAVISGELSVIAECTPSELEHCARKAPALINAFTVLRLAPPPAHEVPGLLLDYQTKRGAKVTVHPAGMKRLVGHLESFQRGVMFPGKGTQFLDWLAADSGPDKEQQLYPADVSQAYARYSGLPLVLISDEYAVGTDDVARALTRGVIGQDAACKTAAGVVARYKAGLNDPGRPVGTLLFVGPTGVGKTELAKQLARYLYGNEERMVRLDMSEYMLPGSAARLLEVGAGTKSLAERVREAPLSLVLLDELEKAAPEVFDLLLGVLGEGRLDDQLGRQVDFKGTLVVMTSNLGSGGPEAVGFGAETSRDYTRAVRDHFRPELFARIDHVVSFARLTPSDVLSIVDLTISALAERRGLVRRNLVLDVAPKARQLLARHGYDPARGARPLKRVVEERVVTPVAERMAADPSFRDRTIPVVARTSQAYLRLSEEERREVVAIDD